MKQFLPILTAFFLLSFNAQSQVPGSGLDFDGSDDYVDCPLPSVFNSILTNDFTIEFWATPTIGNFQRIFFAQFDIDNFASISLTDAGEVVFYVNQNGLNQSLQSADVVNSLELVHIAGSWNATTQEAKIFVNGNETAYATGVYVSSTATDGKMAIGARTDGSQVFTGDIDELSIWSIAKTECEVSFEMNDKKEGTEPNLVTYYNFDQGIAEGSNPGVDELEDQTSAGNDGTLMGFTLSGNNSNWVTSIVDIYQFWGDVSGVLVGQLGLVSTINADEYQWIYCSDLTPVPGATGVSFDPPTEDPNYTGTNDFYAVVSTKGNCSDTSGCFNSNGDVLSMDEVDLESFVLIYPNPSNGLISIETSLEIESVEIRKITGELIDVVNQNGSANLQIDLSEKNGFYLVLINTESGVLVKKILVQNL
ncbi:MAG: T9SS type A sorting domain-containing protein [Crocinitomicaceae bacterium]|nr:T9SS type A sorting domain-containing protein [Crocinitomicaceae bacterium]